MAVTAEFSQAELLKLFRDAQKNLIAVIEKSGEGPFSAFRREQLRAIETVIARLTRSVARWTEREIPRLVSKGAEDVLERLAKIDEKEFTFKFAGVSNKAVKFLTEKAALEFGNTMIGLRRNASRAMLDKRLLQEKIVSSVVQGSSVARTQTELIDAMKKDGIEVLRARNGFGRRFSLEHYTNMLVRSQSMAAYNAGAKLQLLGAGRRFAIIPTIRPDIDGEDICNEFERKKYIDLKKDQLPPYHPNCRHQIQPVSFEQLKAERPDLYAIAIRDFRSAA